MLKAHPTSPRHSSATVDRVCLLACQARALPESPSWPVQLPSTGPAEAPPTVCWPAGELDTGCQHCRPHFTFGIFTLKAREVSGMHRLLQAERHATAHACLRGKMPEVAVAQSVVQGGRTLTCAVHLHGCMETRAEHSAANLSALQLVACLKVAGLAPVHAASSGSLAP